MMDTLADVALKLHATVCKRIKLKDLQSADMWYVVVDDYDNINAAARTLAMAEHLASTCVDENLYVRQIQYWISNLDADIDNLREKTLRLRKEYNE